MDALSLALWGESRLATSLEPKPLHGIGFSDPAIYARHLERLTDYRNSWFHQEPRHDITDLSSFDGETFDFVVCSEVLEHIEQPVQVAFDNLFRLLKPGGVLVTSVPLIDGETIERFPRLRDRTVERAGGQWVLRGTDVDTGEDFSSTELVFHGGPGSTLEMRLFGRRCFRQHLTQAGFTDVTEMIGHNPAFGIVVDGTPRSVRTRGGLVEGMHAGVWIARREQSATT